MMDLVSALGGIPVEMAYGDVYSALQTGVIDGAENNWPSYVSTHHYEVAKYFTLDEHTRIPELILTSTMVMNKLPSEDQEIFRKSAREAAEFERKEWEKYEKLNEQKVKDAGTIITILENNAAFQEEVKSLYDEFGKGYEDLVQEIINSK
jgi:TRAP-type C4-dicarboxylate transport system substrate-binding protein